MTPEQEQFVNEYEKLCKKFKMLVVSNYDEEAVLADYNNELSAPHFEKWLNKHIEDLKIHII